MPKVGTLHVDQLQDAISLAGVSGKHVRTHTDISHPSNSRRLLAHLPVVRLVVWIKSRVGALELGTLRL